MAQQQPSHAQLSRGGGGGSLFRAAPAPAAQAQADPPPLSTLQEMLQRWASATGERPPVHSWPRRLDAAANQPAAAAAAASSSASSSAAAAAAAPVDQPRRVLYSRPVAVPAYAHAPVRPVAQADWGAIVSSRGEAFSGSAASGSAAAAASSLSSAAAAAVPSPASMSHSHDAAAAAAALHFPPNMSYDLLLAHVTHLFRAAHSLDRALTSRARKAPDPSLVSRVQFTDAFGTRLSISMAPWMRVSDAVAQLQQSYIPAHLRSWCVIGLLPPLPLEISPAPSAKPELMDLTNEDDEGATNAERKEPAVPASSAQPPSAERVQALSTAMLHQTLVHAQLVAALSQADAAASSDGPSLIAFGNLTVLLRYAPPAAPSSAASSSSSSAAAAAASPVVRTHTLTLQVFGLDLLSSILRRVADHAQTHFAWGLQASATKLYALQRSFSLPLAHLSSVECGGSARAATLLSEQQSLYAAGLTAPDMVLLVEADSAALPAAASVSLTIKTLTGRQILVDLAGASLGGTTVRDLKAILARKEQLPASQQRLLFEGATLEDPARSLESYGIRPDSTLQLLLQLRSNTSGFNLSAGRPGLHPLSCDSREVSSTLSQLMSWTLPPAHKQRGMSSATLVSLLLHTRHLLSTIYAAVLSQVLHGHSSRGKAWVDEAALQSECDKQAQAEPEDLEPDSAAAAAGGDAEQAADASKKRGLSFLANDDDAEDEEAGSAAAASRAARPARLAPSLIDLTAEAPAVRRVFNSSSPILIDDDAEVAPAAAAPVPAPAVAAAAAASAVVDPVAPQSPPPSPSFVRALQLQRRRLDSPPFGAPSASPSWSGEDELPPPLESFHSSR